jgi:hypothetical protein
MGALSGLRSNALNYLLYPAIVGGMAGTVYDYLDQKRDFKEDSALQSVDTMSRGGFTGLGAGIASLAGKARGRGFVGRGLNATAGALGGYMLYKPISDAIKNLLLTAAEKEVDKRQKTYIEDYMNTYGK